MNPQQRREHQKRQIEANTRRAKKNGLGWMMAVAVASVLFVVAIVWIEYRTHSIEECQDACFEQLTGHKSPKDVHDNH